MPVIGLVRGKREEGWSCVEAIEKLRIQPGVFLTRQHESDMADGGNALSRRTSLSTKPSAASIWEKTNAFSIAAWPRMSRTPDAMQS
jgi:hypothetical protein